MTEKESNHLLGDIKEFVQFLTGLWGILSSFTVLFPLSNVLTNAIPVLPSNLTFFTTISTLISIFGVLFLYASRDENKPKRVYLKQALSALLIGILSLVSYLFFLVVYQPIFPTNADIVQWSKWLISIILYTTVFFALTKAFTTLAISEYLEQLGIRDMAHLSKNDLVRRLISSQEHIKKQSALIAKLKQSSTKSVSLPNKQYMKFRGTHGVIEETIIEDAIKGAVDSFEIDVGRYDDEYINPTFSYSIKIGQSGNTINTEGKTFDTAKITLLLIPKSRDYIPRINEGMQYIIKSTLSTLGIDGDVTIQFMEKDGIQSN